MDKQEILNTMASVSAIAENEEERLEDFLPLRSYMALGDPNRFLVLGGRGSGKTRLFKTLLNDAGFAQIVGGQRQLFRPNTDNTRFLAGYDLTDSRFPSPSVLQRYTDERQAAAFWSGSVVILLAQSFRENEKIWGFVEENFSESFCENLRKERLLGRPSRWLDEIAENPECVEGFLDDLDDYLSRTNQWVFLLYDSLDRICVRYVDIFPYIRTLLAFWFAHLHRWKQIKCKIFLRNDLFDSELLSFPDSSKLVSNCLKLEWNTLSLYRLFVKRLANAGNEEMNAYLRLTENLISREPDGQIGYIPTESEDIVKQFVNEMIGPYMGSNNKKGASYSWAPNHLQDAHGVLSPRSFIKCYSVAAQKMLDSSDIEKPKKNRILLPAMIQGAVRAVSVERVMELQEEYSWLEQLKKALTGTTLLISKSDFIKKIRMDLWDAKTQEKLPATSPQGIFDVLQKLGIVYLARDGRVNVPEIYLHGFGMKRKGGLRRPG